MNIKNEKTVINDKELDAVNGGFLPRYYDADSKVPGVEPVIIKPEYEKKNEKDTLVPIPY